MAKSDPEAQGSRYRIAHGWKNEIGSFNLETLKFLMEFREPRSSLYFIYTHTHIFFFSYTYIFFLFSLYSFSFFLYFSFFICSPYTLNCIVLTSSPMLRRFLILGQRSDRDKVGTRNIFPLERYLKSSILAPSCDLP
jgi:hypothetical protein